MIAALRPGRIVRVSLNAPSRLIGTVQMADTVPDEGASSGCLCPGKTCRWDCVTFSIRATNWQRRECFAYVRTLPVGDCGLRHGFRCSP